MKNLTDHQKIIFYDLMLEALQVGFPGIVLQLENGILVAEAITKEQLVYINERKEPISEAQILSNL